MCSKASKMTIFDQKRKFFDKNGNKIEANHPRDPKFGFKNL